MAARRTKFPSFDLEPISDSDEDGEDMLGTSYVSERDSKLSSAVEPPVRKPSKLRLKELGNPSKLRLEEATGPRLANSRIKKRRGIDEVERSSEKKAVFEHTHVSDGNRSDKEPAMQINNVSAAEYPGALQSCSSMRSGELIVVPMWCMACAMPDARYLLPAVCVVQDVACA
jgi:hypothetical protein